jgi:hypothetical protein
MYGCVPSGYTGGMPPTNEAAGLRLGVYATLIGKHHGLFEAPDQSPPP